MAQSARLAEDAGPTPTGYRPADEAQAFAAFLSLHPDFDAAALEELRAAEYGRLDAQSQVYLDYTGGGLFAESQLSDHLDLLRRTVLGNPHSVNPTSAAASELLEGARAAVLRYFNAPAEYRVIFTPNATGALKLVGEAYPFDAGSRLLLTSDNHNSVNGLREFARAAGAATTYVPSTPPSLRADEDELEACLGAADPGGANLFAYPAQSNFSGVQHPLEWIASAQSAGWDVLVDCAAFVPSNRLDLTVWQPDFVPISLYKLLGYPTGVGCLLVRERALARLRRPWFSGGAVSAVSVQGDWHMPADGEAAFEDGTVNYLALPAVELGLRYLERIGIDTIHTRVRCLTAWLLGELAALRHASGGPVVQVHGPQATTGRGGTIAFNFLRPDGRLVDIGVVDERAAERGISLRTGCFCNPGAAEHAFGVPREALIRQAESAASASGDHLRALGIESGGAVRVSLGLPSTFRDVHRFMRFASSFREERSPEPRPTRSLRARRALRPARSSRVGSRE
jgi:molybdenum cofactor sulfurtransferase